MSDARSVEIELEYPLRENEFWNAFGVTYATPDADTKKEKHMKSIELRLRKNPRVDGGLLGEVVKVGYLGNVSGTLVINVMSLNLSLGYEVISASPEGEVRITDETHLKVKMKFQQ